MLEKNPRHIVWICRFVDGSVVWQISEDLLRLHMWYTGTHKGENGPKWFWGEVSIYSGQMKIYIAYYLNPLLDRHQTPHTIGFLKLNTAHK